QLYFQANGWWAVIDLANQVYRDTFYPLIQIYLVAKLIDILASHKHVGFPDIMSIVIFYGLAMAWQYILNAIAIIRGPGYEFALNDYIELQIDKKLNTLDPAVFEKTEFQTLLAQMDGANSTILSYVNRIINFVSSLAQFITAAMVVGVHFPLFVILIIVSVIPGYVSLNAWRDMAWPFMSRERGIMERLLQYIKLTFSNPATAKEVVIFNNGQALLKKVKSTQASYYRRYERAYLQKLFSVIVSSLIPVAAFAYTQIINLMAVFAGKLSIGQFTLYLQQTFNLATGAVGILDNFSSMSMRNKMLDQYFELLNYPNQIVSPKKPVSLNDTKEFIIEFKNISFKYPDSKRYILKDFNLTIQPGEKIALVGENGAGKSTLIKLLLRFYDVTDGEVLVNGVNIKEIDLAKWQKQIGALFQDFIKYQFSFRENVIFGDIQKQKDELAIKKAIAKSGADAFLKDLPNGLEQIVGKTFEEGVDLSGGQWQKLALARAFFRDAPLLVLDEPTSAIDAKAEYEIFERVQNLQREKTVIIISHRFSTVRNADRILVLDNGKIIEEGDHEALMKKKGLYEELFTIQAKGYQ
ncbi:MAG: ABC transporter ATP-binding protein, partial [Candidatus Levyibacteriota bacterium]